MHDHVPTPEENARTEEELRMQRPDTAKEAQEARRLEDLGLELPEADWKGVDWNSKEEKYEALYGKGWQAVVATGTGKGKGKAHTDDEDEDDENDEDAVEDEDEDELLKYPNAEYLPTVPET